MDKQQTWCFLLCINLTASLEFQNFDVVREITAEVAHKYNCGCILVLLPPNATQFEIRFLQKLSFSLAAGYSSMEGFSPKQVKVFTAEDYADTFINPAKLEAGTCFKWLSLVIMTETTQAQLQQLSKSYMFNKPHWLIFSNGSLFANLKGVELHYNSQVWVVQPQDAEFYSISEIYQVKSGFEERINYLGDWSQAYGLRMASLARMLRRGNLEGLKLRAGFTEEWDSPKRENMVCGDMKSEEWFDIYVLFIIESLLNFTTTPRLYNRDGPGVQSANGSWSGLLGLIEKGEIDMIISELDYTVKRVEVVDPLLALKTAKTKIYFPLAGYEFDWKAVFRPFHLHVWFVLLVWIILASIMLNIFTRVGAKFGLDIPQNVTFVNGVLFTLRTLCLQGSSRVPKMWALRILFILSYLIATVMLPSYSAALVSSLSIREPAKPFENLNGLAESNFNLIFMSHSSVAEYMTESKNPNIKKIVNSLWLNDSEIAGTLDKALEYMCTHRKVAVITSVAIDLKFRLSNTEKMCEIASLEETVYKTDQSFALAKNSPYFKIINYTLLKMLETGIIRHYKEKFIPSWRKSKPKFDLALRLQNVAEIFVILFLGYLLSILIFSYEIVKNRYAIT